MDKIPDITLLRDKCSAGQINWSTHAHARMQERNVSPSDVISCINTGVVIEQYPDAYPHPACLILGKRRNNTYIHTVVGYGDDFIWIITAYVPDDNEWTDEFSVRKG